MINKHSIIILYFCITEIHLYLGKISPLTMKLSAKSQMITGKTYVKSMLGIAKLINSKAKCFYTQHALSLSLQTVRTTVRPTLDRSISVVSSKLTENYRSKLGWNRCLTIIYLSVKFIFHTFPLHEHSQKRPSCCNSSQKIVIVINGQQIAMHIGVPCCKRNGL